jgi:hypothetical protein
MKVINDINSSEISKSPTGSRSSCRSPVQQLASVTVDADLLSPSDRESAARCCLLLLCVGLVVLLTLLRHATQLALAGIRVYRLTVVYDVSYLHDSFIIISFTTLQSTLAR